MPKSSELPEQIKILRVKQAMNQSQLGRALGVGQTAVSAWEIGQNAPPTDTLLRMANMADYPDCLFFYAQAGIDPATLDHRRMSAASEALRACLNLLTRKDGEERQRFFARTADLTREQRIGAALRSIAVLGGLRCVPEFTDMAEAFVRLVDQVDPTYRRRVRSCMEDGSAYERIKHMLGAAHSLHMIKEPERPLPRWDMRRD